MQKERRDYNNNGLGIIANLRFIEDMLDGSMIIRGSSKTFFICFVLEKSIDILITYVVV